MGVTTIPKRFFIDLTGDPERANFPKIQEETGFAPNLPY